ncbi:MAG: type II secretion system protein J [Thiohalomonadaceae bacterium]
MLNRRAQGFTLVEMVMTIVLLAILAGVLAPVIASAFRAYGDTKARADLIARGRSALERLGRELRHAVPNSVELVTDAGGRAGIQFVVTTAGGRYVDQFDDFTGGEFTNVNRRLAPGAPRSELYVLGSGLGYGAGDVLVIGNTSPGDLRNGRSAVALTGTAATSVAADGVDGHTVLQFNSFTFQNGSPGRHYTIAPQTVEVGLAADDSLRWHVSNGIGQYDGDGDWSLADPMLVSGVANPGGVTFTYHAGTPAGSGVLQVALTLVEGGEQIQLYQEFHVRNTP